MRRRGFWSPRQGCVQLRVLAQSDAGENAVAFTLPQDAPLERLMGSWCKYHGMQRSAARFLIGDHEVEPEDTCIGLALTSVVSERLLSVTPGIRREGPDWDGRTTEIVVRVLPRRAAR